MKLIVVMARDSINLQLERKYGKGTNSGDFDS
jgi:hypothetical protein